MVLEIMKKYITIVTPVFNDWNCLKHLISDISKALEGSIIQLVVVNDCSSEIPSNIASTPNNITLKKLDLITNVGHQRAIIIGLCYCFENHIDSDYLIVMDSDGEDDPKYIKELLDKCESFDLDTVVFAKRSGR